MNSPLVDREAQRLFIHARVDAIRVVRPDSWPIIIVNGSWLMFAHTLVGDGDGRLVSLIRLFAGMLPRLRTPTYSAWAAQYGGASEIEDVADSERDIVSSRIPGADVFVIIGERPVKNESIIAVGHTLSSAEDAASLMRQIATAIEKRLPS